MHDAALVQGRAARPPLAVRQPEPPPAAPCAVPGCADAAAPERRFCIGHWCRLPRVLRDPVRDAWSVMNDRGSDPVDRIAAMDAHRDALAAVVAWIEAEAEKQAGCATT